MNFNLTEQSILSIVQDDLPDSLTPYADLARQTASSEDVVIELLTRLKKNGVIRRFGASIKHQRTGWAHNAMVAWVADPDLLDEAGRQAASHPLISHCYYRPSSAPDWPYTFYTMLHGKDWSDCESTIEFLQDIPGLGEHAVLKSIKELKKKSMRYFQNSAK